MPTKSENMVKIGRVGLYSEIFGGMCQFCRILDAGTQMSNEISKVTGPRFTKFFIRCSQIIAAAMRPSALQYSNPFWNSKATNE